MALVSYVQYDPSAPGNTGSTIKVDPDKIVYYEPGDTAGVIILWFSESWRVLVLGSMPA